MASHPGPKAPKQPLTYVDSVTPDVTVLIILHFLDKYFPKNIGDYSKKISLDNFVFGPQLFYPEISLSIQFDIIYRFKALLQDRSYSFGSVGENAKKFFTLLFTYSNLQVFKLLKVFTSFFHSCKLKLLLVELCVIDQ